METSKNNLEEEKALFVAGRLDAKRDYLFRKKMQEDDALREEVELLLAMRKNERVWQDDAVQEKTSPGTTPTPETRVIPLYKTAWLRAAAVIVILVGITWLAIDRGGSESNHLSLSVHDSADGSLGWSESASGTVITVFDKSEGEFSYRFFNDTLRIVSPAPVREYADKKQNYLLNDLKNRKLVLVLKGKKYEIEADTPAPQPLKEAE